MREYIRIHEKDNVIVALMELKPGMEVPADGRVIRVLEPIPAGHKMAIADILESGEVVKYGCRIGIAKEKIAAGSWVHTHNVITALGELAEYTYEPMQAAAAFQRGAGMESGADTGSEVSDVNDVKLAGGAKKTVFDGFVRGDGKVGIRNDVWIIPTVGCVSKIAEALAGQARKHVRGTVEDVIAFTHPYGCSQMGEDQENTGTILADLIGHPNAGGVLVLGLGCENSNIDVLKKYIGEYDERRIRFLNCQDEEDEMETGRALLDELIDFASGFERTPVSASKLIVGMKCGGSDGFSGITANPLVGRFSDLLIREGGTTILTEVPEMFGAETLLMNRCENRELFEQTVKLINDFKQYFIKHGQPVYENPSPGNKAGGITTLEDKSLGCTQKSGSAPVRGILAYGQQVKTQGLNLLSAPGNDPVAATALAAAGAQMVLFTTGRGTPFACPVPTVKISSNSMLAQQKKNWIDFDAGELAHDADAETESHRLFEYVLQVASGRKVRSEEAGLWDMAIFKQGVTL